MSTSSNKAGIVRVGVEFTTSENYMHYEFPGEKAQQRQRQDGISNPKVRSGQTQGGNAENTSLLSKTPVSGNGGTLTTSSQPVISNVQMAVPGQLKKPNLTLFKSLSRMGDCQKIKEALLGFDVHMPMENKVTMLEDALVIKAVSLGGSALVQALMEMGSRFDLVNPDRPRVLESAVEIDNIDLVTSLISRCKDKSSQAIHEALLDAVRGVKPKIAAALLKEMPKIDPSLIKKNDPQILNKLFAEAVFLRDLEIIKMLLSIAPDIDVNAHVSGEQTALSIAAGIAEPDIVEFLLSKGAKVNGANKFDRDDAVVNVLAGRIDYVGRMNADERELYRQKKLKTLQKLLEAKDVSIDFSPRVIRSHGRKETLYEIAAANGPYIVGGSEFVTCLAQAHLRLASKRTGVLL